MVGALQGAQGHVQGVRDTAPRDLQKLCAGRGGTESPCPMSRHTAVPCVLGRVVAVAVVAAVVAAAVVVTAMGYWGKRAGAR